MKSCPSPQRRLARVVAVVVTASFAMTGLAQAADDLTEMSLEDLMNVKVTSATKREQNKVDAAAAITVLTNEDITRSGATSVPDALRMVPGLDVAQITASRWAISARGYNGQFANKLLVLIDGRVVYTPLFGGVYWDVQDVVLEDIDRIEVIRGPGGTLWGANAVNGVINITTKAAKDTQGVLATGIAGNQEYIGEGRYGGKIGEDVDYRVYGKGFKRDDYVMPPGAIAQAHDEWWQWRVGARVDSQITEKDLVTIQGDFYDGVAEDPGGQLSGPTPPFPSDSTMRGGNVLTRWTHTFSDTQSAEFQAYWDQTQRDWASVYEKRNTFDLSLQHNFSLSDDWLFNWGAEYFWTDDETTSTGALSFVPPDQVFYRASGFVQAQWNLFDDALQLIAGTKLEYNTYTHFEYQPSGRLLWKMFEGNAVWASVSRAVREPTRVDTGISVIGVSGNPGIGSEDLLAYEWGYRNYVLSNVNFDLTFFVNKYSDMVGLGGTTFNNAIDSKAWGGEAEITWQVIDQLRFVTSYAYLQVDDDLNGDTQVFGTNDGSSPQHTWMLRGMWNLPWAPVELDSTVWYVGKLTSRFDPAYSVAPIDASDPNVGAYWRLDMRAAWQATDWLELSFVAQNITDKMHPEWGVSSDLQLFPGDYVPRSYYGKVTLEF